MNLMSFIQGKAIHELGSTVFHKQWRALPEGGLGKREICSVLKEEPRKQIWTV